MATASTTRMFLRRTLSRFQVLPLGIGFHPKFRKYLPQILRCLRFAALRKGSQPQTTQDFSAFGSRSAKAVPALATKMPRQRLARKKNGSQQQKAALLDVGMAICTI